MDIIELVELAIQKPTYADFIAWYAMLTEAQHAQLIYGSQVIAAPVASLTIAEQRQLSEASRTLNARLFHAAWIQS